MTDGLDLSPAHRAENVLASSATPSCPGRPPRAGSEPWLQYRYNVPILHTMNPPILPRILRPTLEEHLALFPAVAVLGPRQVGKTTLARAIADAPRDAGRGGRKPGLYLDLENPNHLGRLSDARGYLGSVRNRLVVLDEIHRVPEAVSGRSAASLTTASATASEPATS